MMSAAQAQNDLKKRMWTRLSSSRDAVDLDERIEEEPEDLFVQLAEGDSRDQVISSLNALLVEELAGGRSSALAQPLRFLKRALRLCDALGAEEFEGVLRLLLCERNIDSRWGNDLAELQELAARALSGLSLRSEDLQFWSDVAHRRTGATSYALNALLEIDLAKGLEQFCSVRLAWFPTGQDPEPDWTTILQMAVSREGIQEFTKHLGAACNHRRGPKAAREYFEEFAELAGIPSPKSSLQPSSQQPIPCAILVGAGLPSGSTQGTNYVLNTFPGKPSEKGVTIQLNTQSYGILRDYLKKRSSDLTTEKFVDATAMKPPKAIGNPAKQAMAQPFQYTS